jgi:uncharacterized membrane protein
MMLAVKAYIAAAVIFAVADGIWLGLVARTFYASQLGELMRAKIAMAPAVLFYALYVAGLVVFAVLPAVEAGSWTRAALLGGFLGLVAYGTYDLTNLATLKGWPLQMSLADMAWGTIASAIAATGAYFIARAI